MATPDLRPDNVRSCPLWRVEPSGGYERGIARALLAAGDPGRSGRTRSVLVHDVVMPDC
jgi:hypothetical protein